MRSIEKKWIWPLILIALFVPGAFGQTAQMTGLVTDPSGTIVPGATVAIRNVATAFTTATVTNERGYYTLSNLNPGTYDISVQRQGFRTSTQTGIKLDVAQVARLDVSLTIGEVRESVTVAAEA
ncbi:MAG TPA: carboxypeptidase-like regulatory domain-containing protein, partial [Bryobacteraceae bacterium]|nr:carboxypeptidase-like regulatory domain-containing protein [Bryobacteraceae bacterium]